MKNILDIWRSETVDPWREFRSLQRQMDRLFDGFERKDPSMTLPNEVSFVPACEVEETETDYFISLDLPGMTRDQLHVEITGNTLRVSGEKRAESKAGKGARRSSERYYGRFERSFTLPDLASSDKVEADYTDGVLCVSIPKSEEAKAKTRKIQIGEGKTPLFGKSPQKTEEKKEQKAAPERAA